MAFTIGTFPILNSKKSQTDEFSFDYITYQYTAPLSQLTSLLPKKDDKFSGISPNTFSAESNYVVTDTETNLANGGLVEFVIQTTGTRNAINANAPKIALIPNSGPLIFGIGTVQPSEFFPRDGTGALAGKGITVQLEFLGEGGAEAEATNIQTYLFSVMPTIFRGVTMPIARQEGYIRKSEPRSFDTYLLPSVFIGIRGFYSGYRCISMRVERRGGLALYALSFQETGYSEQVFDISNENNPGGTNTVQIYNFSFHNL